MIEDTALRQITEKRRAPHAGCTRVISEGNLAAAEESLKRAIIADAENLSAYALLGSLYVSQHRLEDAYGSPSFMAPVT